VTTDAVSLSELMKTDCGFWNWKQRFVSTYGANNADHNGSDGCHTYVLPANDHLWSLNPRFLVAASFSEEIVKLIRRVGRCPTQKLGNA
jgi:hypothetical protein